MRRSAVTSLLCPNGCEPSYLLYEQDEITFRAYNVVWDQRGNIRVNWESVAAEKCLGGSEIERYLVCLGCATKRFATAKWDGSLSFVSDKLEACR